MKFVIRFIQENFALPFAFAGVAVYSLLIAVVNFDKQFEEILVLMTRQAIFTFPVTGLLVPRVRKAVAENHGIRMYAKGILVPSLWVTTVSALAHWYFTDELRNVFAPFLLSATLNTFLVTAYRAGQMTFFAQVKFFFRGCR